MKSTILSLIFLLSAFNVHASSTPNSTIVCGDTNSAYATSEMQDLSEYFVKDHLSLSDRADYKQQGYKYIIAGRNCGLNSYDSETQFEVLFLFQGKNTLKELIDLSIFSVFGAKIVFNGSLDENLKSDLVLDGDSKELLQEVDGTLIAAKLESGRGSGKVKVIIRQK